MANINGTNGDDNIGGTNDHDIINAFGGNDTIWGFEGNDYADGGDGNDIFVSGPGIDVFTGGPGNDAVHYSSSPRGVGIYLNYGYAADGLGFTDYLNEIEIAVGSNFDDTIHGNDVANLLFGLGGNDILAGWFGNDYLLGGPGVDQLYGGAGTDLFDMNDGVETWFDTVNDFKRVDGDIIAVETIDARSDVPGDQAFVFVGFTGNENTLPGRGQLGYYQNAGGDIWVHGNTDSDNEREVHFRVFFPDFQGNLYLIASDFFL
jgi:Ca2+-binding RTX toxin-like protein